METAERVLMIVAGFAGGVGACFLGVLLLGAVSIRRRGADDHWCDEAQASMREAEQELQDMHKEIDAALVRRCDWVPYQGYRRRL